MAPPSLPPSCWLKRRPGVGTERQHRLDYQVEVTLGWKAYLSIVEPLYLAQTFT